MIALLLQSGAAAPPLGVDTSLIRAFFGLLFVLSLVAGLAFLVRRGVITLPGRRGSGALTIEHTLPLGDRRALMVVNVEGRRLLIGSTVSNVSLVTELQAATEAFAQVLDGATGRQS